MMHLRCLYRATAAVSRVGAKLTSVESDLRGLKTDLERRGGIIQQPGDELAYEVALKYYEQALEIDPSNTVLQRKVSECKRNLNQ